MQPDRVTILAEIAEKAEEIDVARAEAAKKRAEAAAREADGRHGCRAGADRAAQVADPPAGRDPRQDPIMRLRIAGWQDCRKVDESLAILASAMFRNLAQLIRYRGLISEPRRARAEGALPRLGARLPLVVHQPAAAAVDLHVRLHGDPAEPERGRAAVRAVHVLRHPAVELVLVVADWRRPDRSIAGGNLIKKVLFPAEMLPIVSVLANMVHFFLGAADSSSRS